MGKGKSNLTYIYQWFNAVPGRWIAMLVAIITYLGGGIALAVWLISHGLVWWWLALYIVALAGFWVLSCFSYIRVAKERDQARGGSGELAKFTITWGDREDWWLSFGNGKANFWEHDNDGQYLLLEGFVAINTMDKIQIESVGILIGGQEYPSDWQSGSFYTMDEPDISFNIPFDIQRGRRTANLTAIVDGKPYQGRQFNIEIPPAKP
jgi:hypothetical protein